MKNRNKRNYFKIWYNSPRLKLKTKNNFIKDKITVSYLPSMWYDLLIFINLKKQPDDFRIL